MDSRSGHRRTPSSPAGRALVPARQRRQDDRPYDRLLRHMRWRAGAPSWVRARVGACLSGLLCAGLVTTWQLQMGSPLGAGDGPAVGLMERSPAPPRAPGRRRLARMTAALLDSLGPTPGAVAESLYRAGARGERGKPTRAPLAVFLGVVLAAEPGIRSASVDLVTVTVIRRRRWHRVVTVPLPAAASTFATTFEGGGYALLVRPH